MPSISALRRQRKVDTYGFEDSLFYITSSRPTKATLRKDNKSGVVVAHAFDANSGGRARQISLS